MDQGVVWQPQTKLKQQTDPNWPWAADVGPYHAQFASYLDAATLYQFTVQGYVFGYVASALSYIDAGQNHQVLSQLAHVGPTTGTDGSSVIYDASSNGYTVTYEVQPDRVKMYDTLLKRLPDPDPTLVDVNTASLSTLGYLVLPAGLSPWAEGQPISTTAPYRTAAQIELRDSGLNTIMVLDQVVGHDAKGVTLRGEYLVQWDATGKQWQLYTLVDNRQLRVATYPVTIDPTTVATATAQIGGFGNRFNSAQSVVRSGSTLVTGLIIGNVLQIYKSTDGGNTWSNPSSITPYNSTALSTVSFALNGTRLVMHYCTAVSSTTLHDSYWSTRYSDDFGVTWSAENQIFHFIQNGNTGTGYGISYCAVRYVGEKAANYFWAMANDAYGQFFFAYSTDNGVTWTVAGRGISPSYIPNTISLAYWNGNFYVAWGNTGNGSASGYGMIHGTDPLFGTYTQDFNNTSGGVNALYFSDFAIVNNSLYIMGAYPNGTVNVFSNTGSGWSISTTYTGTPDTVLLASSEGAYVCTYAASVIDFYFLKSNTVYSQRYTVTNNTWGTAAAVSGSPTNLNGQFLFSDMRSLAGNYAVGAQNVDIVYQTGTANPYTAAYLNTTYNVAPTAPTNLSIGSGTAFDGTQSTTASATYNDTPGDTCVAYQAQFWQGSTLLYDTNAVTLSPGVAAGGPVSFTVPAGKFANGTDGTWQIKLQDAGGLWSPYSSAVAFHAEAPPTTTITQPGSSLSSGQILVMGAYAQPNSKTMQAFQVQLFAGASATGNPIEDTGTITSSKSPWSRTLSTVGANNQQYTVQARTQTADGLWGPWSAAVTFTVSYTPPLVLPGSLTVTADAVNAALQLTYLTPKRVLGTFTRSSVAYDPTTGAQIASGTPRYQLGRYQNQLTANQSNGGEDGTTTGASLQGGAAVSKATLSRNTATPLAGKSSWQVVVSGYATGDDINLTMSGATESSSGTIVLPSMTYAFQAKVQSPVGVTASLRIIQWSSAGAVVADAILSTSDTTGAAQVLSGTLTTASTTASVTVRIRLNGNGTFLADSLQIEQNASISAWMLGGSGQAILVEEGAANLAANPFFGGTYSGGVAPNWIAFGTPTLSENTNLAYVKFGAKSQHVVASAANHGVYQTLTYTAATAYHRQCWVYVVSGRVMLTVSGTDHAGANGQYISPAGVTGWVLLMHQTLTTDATPSNVYIQSYGGAAEFYADSVMVEQRAYPTSFTDTTRAAETLTIPTSGNWNKGAWSVEFWFKPTSPAAVAGRYARLFALTIDANNGYALLLNPSGQPYTAVQSGGTNYQAASPSAAALQTGTMYHFAIRGNGATMAMFVNGVKTDGDIAYVEPVGTLPANMYLGSDSYGGQQANGLYDDFRISNIGRTDTQIAADYNSGAPLAWDANTLVYAPFDSNLEAGNQNGSWDGNAPIFTAAWNDATGVAQKATITPTVTNPSGVAAVQTSTAAWRQPLSKTTYTFTAACNGNNGTVGPTISASASVTLRDVWITDTVTYEQYQLSGNAVIEPIKHNLEETTWVSTTGIPSYGQGVTRYRTFKVSGVLMPTPTDTVLSLRNKWAAFSANGNPKLVRDSQGWGVTVKTRNLEYQPGPYMHSPRKPVGVSVECSEVI